MECAIRAHKLSTFEGEENLNALLINRPELREKLFLEENSRFKLGLSFSVTTAVITINLRSVCNECLQFECVHAKCA